MKISPTSLATAGHSLSARKVEVERVNVRTTRRREWQSMERNRNDTGTPREQHREKTIGKAQEVFWCVIHPSTRLPASVCGDGQLSPSALVCPAILRAAEPGRRPSPCPHSASPSSSIPAFFRCRPYENCWQKQSWTTLLCGRRQNDKGCDKGREECYSPEGGGASWRPPVTGFLRPLPWLRSLSTKSREQT